MGFAWCGTDANVALTTFVHAAVEILAYSTLPLILDGACGWGDAAHVRNTAQHAEAAGFQAIEIEGQIFPARASSSCEYAVSGRRTTVEDQCRAGHEGAFVSGKIGCECSDLVGVAEPAYRMS